MSPYRQCVSMQPRSASADRGTQTVQNNATLWAQTFLCANGSSPNPYSPKFKQDKVYQTRKCVCTQDSFMVFTAHASAQC